MNNVLPISNFRRSCESLSLPLPKCDLGTVEFLHGTLARSLRPLQREMLRENSCTPEQRFLRSVRPFRQKFCFLARKFSGLSAKELCSRLNEHPDILKLHRYPCYNQFYPITPEFLSDLESNISKIFEYCSSGFAFGGIGVPTDEIARAIADICGANDEHKEFIQWCIEYRFGNDFDWR